MRILTKEQQAKGSFDGGAIIENKPIGFPQDRGEQKPFSNLFYWANAWSDRGGLIGEHPHQLFEIMSFVIDGEIQHYDNKYNRWLSLKKGDVQIIRSGNGIRHAEKIMPGGRMFQIWFDPNVHVTYNKEASYNDYKSENMHYFEENGIKVKNYIGKGGPVEMDAEAVVISELTLPKGNHIIAIPEGKTATFYFINGKAQANNQALKEHDFIITEDEKTITFDVEEETHLFTVEVAKQLSYKTYLELNKFN